MTSEATLFDSRETRILHQIINEIKLQIATSKRMASVNHDPLIVERHVGLGAYLVKLLDFINVQMRQPDHIC